MYLEAVYVLLKKNEAIRAIDIGNYLGYSKPSVSRAVGILKNEGYITIGDEGHITLTADGLAVAAQLYERHTILSDMLVSFGVGAETAAEDACRIEHVISDETFAAIKKFLRKD
jgi:Mn-dependent DtxR family transcriptional regulator